MKLKKNLKTATVGIYREIWWSNRETGRLDEKLGELAGLATAAHTILHYCNKGL